MVSRKNTANKSVSGSLVRVVSILVLTYAPGSMVHALEAAEVDTMLAARIAEIKKDNRARETAIKIGREQATFCAYCHGLDGNSSKPEIPNLANQNPTYLLDQIEKFADGRRKDYTTVMQQLSTRLTAEEKVALAVYYASVPLQPARGNPKLAEKGWALYLRLCQHCHGQDGRGTKGYARVAGQQPEYVTQTLKNFRAQKDRRLSPEMFGVTRSLTDDDIQALAAYVANLR